MRLITFYIAVKLFYVMVFGGAVYLQTVHHDAIRLKSKQNLKIDMRKKIAHC